ncbi:MAG: twin-arginine translocation signal domain-containing protein [bacterium]|nr:twin-arginine translocation signal domain-containing protein [bacterium]
MTNPELQTFNKDDRLSRRSFLRLASLAGAGIALATIAPSFLVPQKAQAEEEWIDLGPDPGELNQKEWFPYDAAVARDGGRVRMHSLGGPLDIHDQISGHHAREWEEDIANASLRRSPLKRGWLGHCDDVANIMAYHIPLASEVAGGTTFLFEGLEIDRTKIIGLQAEKHSHDAMVAYRNHPTDIRALLAVAIQKGWAPVSNIPGLGREGQVWSYVIKRVRADLERVEAYNFGRVINVSTNEINGIYFPYHYNPNDPESFQGIDSETRAKTLMFFNPELDHELVDAITQNQSRS